MTYMTVIFIVLLAAILMALTIFLIPIKINSNFELSTEDVYAQAAWSFIKAELNLIDGKAFLRVFLFKIKVFSKFLRRRRKKAQRSAFQVFKSLSLSNTSLDVSYGFNEPFATGFFPVILNFIAVIFNITEISFYPNFLPEAEFLKIKVETNLSIGETIINLSRQRIKPT